MLPSGFTALESMPLTETGKIDRASLPAPERIRPELSQDYVAPKSALETIVAGIFSEVLNLERVGTLDSFFELGGHSLIATQAVSRIRQLLTVELPLKTIFEEPTVSGLAAAILRHETEPARVEATAELILSVSELSEESAILMLDRAAGHEPTGGAQ
jgi:acyl carrier protein